MFCCFIKDSDLKECVICLSGINKGQGKKLECGHEFHEPVEP